MSNHPNHRRGEEDRTEHGSRWEGDDNSRCASKARASWKRLHSRIVRRTGETSKAFLPVGRPSPLPSAQMESDTGSSGMDRETIITELDAIEADAPPCLPDADCTCPTCERYCELFGMLDALNEVET